MDIKIMLIDDSLIVRKSLKKVLSLVDVHNEQILEAGNGEEALQTLKTEKVDLIFLDINMPKMNGIEFLKQARELQLLNSARVIVVSTEGSHIRADELIKLGVSLQLRKPVRPEQVAQALKSIQATV